MTLVAAPRRALLRSARRCWRRWCGTWTLGHEGDRTGLEGALRKAFLAD